MPLGELQLRWNRAVKLCRGGCALGGSWNLKVALFAYVFLALWKVFDNN